MSRSSTPLRFACLLLLVALAGCEPEEPGDPGDVVDEDGDGLFTIGGTFTGLGSESPFGIFLYSHGGDATLVMQDGPFVMDTPVPDGSSYSIHTQDLHEGWTCSVENAEGFIDAADVTDVIVTCIEPPEGTPMYGVSGQLYGDARTVSLSLNEIETIEVHEKNSFGFGTLLRSGDPYSVRIESVPDTNACEVFNGEGVIDKESVRNVWVQCEWSHRGPFPVGVVFTNLGDRTVTLRLEYGPRSAPGEVWVPSSQAEQQFILGIPAFTQQIPYLSRYRVSLVEQPEPRACRMVLAEGIVEEAVQVRVACESFIQIGGSTSGLTGAGLVLSLNGEEELPVDQEGSFVFAGGVFPNRRYDVEITSQPDGQQCVVSNASGWAPEELPVTDVLVTCH